MSVSLVVAVARNGVIGKDGSLPWRLPDDLSFVRRLTLDQAVVMGRKTHQSIGRPLDRRRNIILTRSAEARFPGCLVARSPQEAVVLAEPLETFVLGGAAVYESFLPLADRLYITWIDAEVEGDTRFPAVPWDAWELVSERPASSSAGLPHRFTVYQRRRS